MKCFISDKKRKEKSFSEKLTTSLKSADIFGYPITLKYQGEQQHKSLIGGLATVLSLIGLAVFAAIMLINCFTNQSYSINSYMQKMN